MKVPPLAVLGALLIINGCGQGGFEQSQITGECGGALACGIDLSGGPLAVGASFEIRPTLDSPGAGLPAIRLQSANSEVIEVNGDTLTGLGQGMSAVVITDEQGLAIDFFHAFVELPDHIQLVRVGDELSGSDIDGAIELLVGDELVLQSRPSKNALPLAGTAASLWMTESAAITILADGDPSRRRLVARSTGTATIIIESMGLSRQLTLNVLP